MFEEAVGTIHLTSLSKAHGAAFVRFLSDAGSREFRSTTARKHGSTSISSSLTATLIKVFSYTGKMSLRTFKDALDRVGFPPCRDGEAARCFASLKNLGKICDAPGAGAIR